MMYDVVTLGETMIRLTPPGWNRLESTESLEVHVGGSESNTAVGLARLGRRVAWLSRLTSNAMGHLIANKLASHRVDTSHVVWTDQDRIGTYYLERGCAPRNTQVIYDRRDSAMSHMTPEDLSPALFQPKGARVFHTTGITLGISETSARTAFHAAQLAKQSGWIVSFDLNYRAKLWTPAACRESAEAFMKLADLIFLPIRDARNIFRLQELSPESVLQELGRMNPQATLVMTMGQEGSMARSPDGSIHSENAFQAVEVDRLGGGDAFSSGFLHAMLDDKPHKECLRWGNAVASLKYSIPGDLPIVDLAQVVALVDGNRSQGIVR
jgi:2-dehydro-3-deoxygluconokinase